MWVPKKESFSLLPTAISQSGSMGVWEVVTGGQYPAAAFFASEPNSLTPLATTLVTKKHHLGCQTKVFSHDSEGWELRTSSS